MIIIPILIAVLVVGTVVYFVLQTGAVNGIAPAATLEHATAAESAAAAVAESADLDATEEPAMPDETISCAFDFLLGLDAAKAVEQIAPLGRPYRVLGPGDAATMDFSEERINLQTDDSGKVVAVTCG